MATDVLVRDFGYHLKAIQGNGTKVDVDEVLEGSTLEEFPGQLAMRLTATVKNDKVGKKRAAQLLANGTEVRARCDHTSPSVDPEIFRGRIFRNSTVRSGIRNHDLVAYDPLFYLLRSQDDRYYKAGITATEMIDDILTAWGVPHDLAGGPTTKLAKKAFRHRSLGEMCLAGLRETARKDGGRFLLVWEDGKARLRKRGWNKHIWYFEADNLEEARTDRSIENLITVVKIVGRTKKASKVLATGTTDLVDDYGRIQAIIDRSAYDSPGAAEKAAKRMLRDQGAQQVTHLLSGPDVPEMRRGHRCHVETGTLQGLYLVRGVSHDSAGKRMQFEVTRPGSNEIDIDWEETGLDEWIPPEDRNNGPSKGGVSTKGFGWPADGPITSDFGDSRDGGSRSHAGIDIDGETGDPIWASRAGKVTFAGTAGGYGLVIYIRHDDGWETRYAHLSSMGKSPGAKVDRGELIGRMGSTGTSTGAHLHFETRHGGVAIDPRKVLP